MEKVSFVIPCYASANTLPSVIEEINSTMNNINEYAYEIILVNDCSPDNTYEVIKNLSEAFENIVGINLARNFGQHAALMAGFNCAKGDIVVCLDDDGQTPANEVGKLLDKIKEGYDVVYAQYGNKKHSSFRNWGSRLNSKMTEVLLEKPKNLFISSYFAMRKFVVLDIIKYQHSYPYVIGLVLRTTKNITNVPVNHRERTQGQSGYTLKKLIGLWSNGFTAFSVKPLRIASLVGVLFAMIGFIYALVLIIRKIIFPAKILLGWSSIVCLMMILGGIILVVLGIIGEYIGRMYICINNAPQYVIKETIGKKDDE